MKKNDEIDRIGNIYGFTGGSFAGMVYGVSGCAPTLNTMGGAGENLLSSSLHQHYREPLIVEFASTLQRTSYRRVCINTTDGCAFAIRTGYERHAYLNGMTRGGGFYPATGVLEIYEDTEDTTGDEEGLY